MISRVYTLWPATSTASAALVVCLVSFVGFVFRHDFGPGVLPAQGSDGYFLISRVLSAGLLSFLVTSSVGFLSLLMLSHVLIRKLSKVGAVIVLVSVICLANLINWTGTKRGLYEFGAFFRTSMNDYSVELMFSFSWVFVLVALAFIVGFSLLIGAIFRASRTSQ